MLVDSAVYVDGRLTTATTLKEAYRVSREPGKFAWVTLQEPTEEEVVSVAEEFGLGKLAMEDAIEPPPASEGRALRRTSLRRAQTGALRRGFGEHRI